MNRFGARADEDRDDDGKDHRGSEDFEERESVGSLPVPAFHDRA
jgi:hypothetical protein